MVKGKRKILHVFF